MKKKEQKLAELRKSGEAFKNECIELRSRLEQLAKEGTKKQGKNHLENKKKDAEIKLNEILDESPNGSLTKWKDQADKEAPDAKNEWKSTTERIRKTCLEARTEADKVKQILQRYAQARNVMKW
ncbi:unnamed protein product, partial [Amoebophrya sp. A25]|eukprot:GSA25T00001682001.1